MVERNVTRAAAQLAMTQPAVSNALRRLREATGDELFVTVPSGVVPTAKAEAWWPEVSASLEALRKVFDPQGFEPSLDQRSFALAMADATATVLMPALVAALAGGHARIDLRVLPLVSRDPRPLLEQGSADLALGFFPTVAQELAAEGGGRWRCSSRSTAASTSASCGAITRSPPAPLLSTRRLLRRRARARQLRRTATRLRRRRARRARPGAPRRRPDGEPVRDRRARRPRVGPAVGAAAQLRPGERVRRRPGDARSADRLPRIEVAMLWHRRHERDPAQRWLRDTVARSCAASASASRAGRRCRAVTRRWSTRPERRARRFAATTIASGQVAARSAQWLGSRASTAHLHAAGDAELFARTGGNRAARRCCCCTAIPRRTSCGSASPSASPPTSRSSSPTCAATATRPSRHPPRRRSSTTRSTASARWPSTW